MNKYFIMMQLMYLVTLGEPSVMQFPLKNGNCFNLSKQSSGVG